jgi:hypothetical protein
MKRFFYVLIFVAGFMLLNNKVSAEYSKVNAVTETILESVNTNAVNAADAVSESDTSLDADWMETICLEYVEVHNEYYEEWYWADNGDVYFYCYHCRIEICILECWTYIFG